MTEVTSRKAIVLVAALFVAAPSLAMAQNTTVNPGGNTLNTYTGPEGGGASFPLEAYGNIGPANSSVGQPYYGVGVGNGFAGVSGGTNTNGQIKSYSVGTQLPGEACLLVPGTDVPYDCENN